MTSGSFRSVSRPRDRRKSQSARLRVLASQSEAALERSETFLRNQDPFRKSSKLSFDHLVGGREQRLRHGEAEQLGGLTVPMASGLYVLHRTVRRLFYRKARRGTGLGHGTRLAGA